MVTVAITAVGSGVGQAVLDSLRDSSLEARVVGFEAGTLAKGVYECDAAYRVPYARDPSYPAAILALCRELEVNALIPGSDPEMLPLARLAPELAALGCELIGSGPACVDICRDKLAFYEQLAPLGVPVVETWSLEAARARMRELPYPLILKPRGGSGSVGISALMALQDWANAPNEGDWVVQPYLLPQTWYEGEGGIQRYLERMRHSHRPLQNDEFIVQALLSREGRTLGCFTSINQLRDGVTMICQPVSVAPYRSAIEGVLDALRPFGVRGPVNIQGRLTREGWRIYEINPRYSGSTHLRALLGYRDVEAAVRHFSLHQSEEMVAQCLQPQLDLVGFRQMTESAVCASRIQTFAERGRLE